MLIGLGIWIMLTCILKVKFSVKLLGIIIIGCLLNTGLDIIVGVDDHTLAYLTLPIVITLVVRLFKYDAKLTHYMLIVFIFTLIQLVSLSSYLFVHWLSYLIVSYILITITLSKVNFDWFFKGFKELNFKIRCGKISFLCIVFSCYTWVVIK